MAADEHWMTIPVDEFERLHDEIRELKANAEVLVLANQTFTGMFEEMARVTRGWQDAEAQIAVLQARLADALADPIVDGRFAHLESENARLLVELAHRVGWEERCLDAEKALLALLVQMDRDVGGLHEGRLSDLRIEAARLVGL